jgi:hypothetical protein
MTKEDVIKMAREAGGGTTWWPLHSDTLERFAALVAAAEREACAKLCADGINAEQYPTLTRLAEMIRARG